MRMDHLDQSRTDFVLTFRYIPGRDRRGGWRALSQFMSEVSTGGPDERVFSGGRTAVLRSRIGVYRFGTVLNVRLARHGGFKSPEEPPDILLNCLPLVF